LDIIDEDATSTEDIIDEVFDGHNGKCITTLNLSGHGDNLLLSFKESLFFYTSLTDPQVDKLGKGLCKDAVINLCSCNEPKNLIS